MQALINWSSLNKFVDIGLSGCRLVVFNLHYNNRPYGVNIEADILNCFMKCAIY